MSRASARLWAVECEDFRTKPTTEEAARNALAAIESAGHCRNQHRLVKVDA